LQGDDVATSWRVIEGFSVGLVIPDLWQQEAVRALQQGKDVVVQAPTGSGKTYINLHQRRVTSDERSNS
jgi:superfamily II DNA/RNA helicase